MEGFQGRKFQDKLKTGSSTLFLILGSRIKTFANFLYYFAKFNPPVKKAKPDPTICPPPQAERKPRPQARLHHTDDDFKFFFGGKF